MDNSLLKYLKKLTHLNRASKDGDKAPHKPILLLSIIESIEAGDIRENKIEITAELIARFRDNWNRLVKSTIFQPNFSLPFFHMKSEGFWHLKIMLGKKLLLRLQAL